MRISDWSSDVCSSDLKAARSRFRLPVLSPDDFPLIKAGELPIAFEMPAEKLSKMFGSARYAISTEETRYYLNGIFFHVLEDELLAVARSEEHTSELQSLMRSSYAVFCLKKKKTTTNTNHYYRLSTQL